MSDERESVWKDWEKNLPAIIDMISKSVRCRIRHWNLDGHSVVDEEDVPSMVGLFFTKKKQTVIDKVIEFQGNEGRLIRYFTTAVSREIRDQVCKEWGRRVAFSSDDAESEISDRPATGDTEILDRRLGLTFDQILEKLKTVPHHEILVMRHLKGMTIKEVALITGLNDSQVFRRGKKAKVALLEILYVKQPPDDRV